MVMNVTAITREPIYPVAYAATLAGLDRRTARRWLRGYDFTRNGERRTSAPVLPAPAEAANDLVSFEELLTLRLVHAFRERGLGLPTIKKAANAAVTRYGVNNPFVTRAFRTDGRQVFLELEQDGALPSQDRVLVHALSGQQQFVDVVEPSLFQDVVFVGDVPGQWFPIGKDRSVVIQPGRAFGAPHIVGTGLRTEVVADAVAAEGDGDFGMRTVAEWFSLTEQQVRDAVEAEEKWRNRKAA